MEASIKGFPRVYARGVSSSGLRGGEVTMSQSWAAPLGAIVIALSCGCAIDSIGTARSAVVCRETVSPDSQGQPRNTAGQIRYCWPGDALCFCDQDNDCYALTGYVPCTPPTDAGADAAIDVPRDVAMDLGVDARVDAGACPPEPTTPDSQGRPRNTAGVIRYCWPGEAHCLCDSDNDCYAESGYVACSRSTDAGADVVTDVGATDVGADAGVNPIVVENARPGTDAWTLSRPSGNHEVEGYASTTSTVPGQSFDLYVNVDATHSVRWEAYRIGYYQNHGGRLIASGGPRSISRQASCPVDSSTGMVECHWGATFTVTPDASWVTGAYLIKLVREDGYDSYVPMIIREPTPRAPLLFQASVNTWQAYNDWGDTSLYVNRLPSSVFSGEHAYGVSFDRPYSASDCCSTFGGGQFVWWEMYMVRWIEQRGYDVSYVTNVDVESDPDSLLRRRMFLTVGHDEYWTTGERDTLERVRAAGVSLGFFSADTGTFQVRYASSSSGVPRRQIICYKTDAQALDPLRGTALATTRFGLLPIPRPENALLGVMYAQWSGGPLYPLVVSNPGHWIFAGTNVARGDALAAIVGSEWDRVHDNGYSPTGLETITESPGRSIEGISDVSHATVYYPTSSSIVFASGTLSWALGLGRPDLADPRIQRMTENILSRAGLPVAVPTVVPPRSGP